MTETPDSDSPDLAADAARRRPRRRFWRILLVVSSFMLLAALGMAAYAGVLIQRAGGWLDDTWSVDADAIDVPDDEASVAEGERLYHARGCADCHGDDLAGRRFLEGGPVGTYIAPGLTTGANGLPEDYTTEDWVRAVRHGVGRDGRALVFMPAHEYRRLSDDDLGRIIAWVRTQAPVDGILNTTRVTVLARLLAGAGKFPLVPAALIDHDDDPPPAPEPAATPQYGEYLAATCTGCHGEGLSGGPIPGAPPDLPPATNLTTHSTGLGSWTLADFERAMREGVRPDGTELDEFMPVRVTRHMTDLELEAVWAYLSSLPPTEYGSR